MGPLHLCIALGPLAVYLLLLGLINLSSRPFLTTGARDCAALSVAISGFVVAGPLDHFFPETAAVAMGGYLLPWLLLVVVALVLFALSELPPKQVPTDGIREPRMVLGFAAKFGVRFSVAYWLLYSLPSPFTGILQEPLPTVSASLSATLPPVSCNLASI